MAFAVAMRDPCTMRSGRENVRGIYLALLALGLYSQVAQALLIRENLVVFYGNEVSLGAFFGSWLLWVAAGSAVVMVAGLRSWARHPLPLLRALLTTLPILLALQIVATRCVRLLLETPAAEFVPLGSLFVSILVITLPTGFGVGLAFPLASKALAPDVQGQAANGTVRNVSRLYILDAVGALLGGVLFTFVMIEWLGVWRSLGVVALVLAMAALSIRGGSRAWTAPMLIGLAGALIAATPLGQLLGQEMESVRFATLQPGLTLLDAVETRYGHVAIARLGEQRSIVIDGRITESFPARRQVEQDAAWFMAQARGARKIVSFGGLAGGLAEELLRYPVERLDVIEEDRRAFDMMRPYLPAATRAAMNDRRLHVHFEDGRRFVNDLTGYEDYDLVLVLAADPSSAHSNRYFTREFYRGLRRAMAPEGVLCTRVSSASNYLGREVRSYSGSIYRTLTSVFGFLAIMPGDDHLYCATAEPGTVSDDPAELGKRYLAIPLEEHRFPSTGFYTLLPGNRVAFIRQQLQEEGGELNTDAKPVTYYLNMVLWGKYSGSEFVNWLERLRAMGATPYVVPLGVLVVMMLLHAGLQATPRPRRRSLSATLALVVLGMIAMAAQIALLFSYQSHVGFMFGRVALLNAVFMTGLALGAGALGQLLARRPHPGTALAILMALIAAALALLPLGLAALGTLHGSRQETVYLLLCTLAGLLTGTGFPLGLQQAHADRPEVLHTSAVVGAADNLGGAVGGLITGALLVPILGVSGTFRLLAVAAIITLLPLLHARFAPVHIPALERRGYHAFPWRGLSGVLLFGVITIFLIDLMARGTAPGPTLHFDDALLARTSGSQAFALREQSFPHYLGQDAQAEAGERDAQAPPDTVSLATMAVAPDIRGYAGPINLLVSVDRAGRLRGVSYLDSEETPSYIADIGRWLEGLAGQDLCTAPLSLAHVDALSGATVSSRAALAAVNRAAQAGSEAAFGRHLTALESEPRQDPWRSGPFLATLALLLAFFPVYRAGSDRLRLLYQAATLLILGVWLNTPVTEMDLVNLSLGHAGSPLANPQRWLLIGFVLLTMVLFGQAWCGYVCPFGALQEFISRLGRLLYLRSYPLHGLDTRMRYVKFLLLALMLSVVWLTGDTLWASFDPMQHLFGGHLEGWMALIILVSLGGALFYYRFWCRYFCPFGAFVALGNKLAVLKSLAPRRRFEHCDIGVRDEYDIDCIHCQRCISGRDFGVRAPRGSTTEMS
jgi:predicted membrane-bound spermidine synthase